MIQDILTNPPALIGAILLIIVGAIAANLFGAIHDASERRKIEVQMG